MEAYLAVRVSVSFTVCVCTLLPYLCDARSPHTLLYLPSRYAAMRLRSLNIQDLIEMGQREILHRLSHHRPLTMHNELAVQVKHRSQSYMRMKLFSINRDSTRSSF